MLGLTFQQVQKYEKGMNRISVARLIEIAKILGVDIHFFLDGVTSTTSAPGFAEDKAPAYVADMMSTPEGLQLVRHFTGISNPKVRKSIVQLVISLAAQDEAERSA
jgi:transcriptional regulator with XRE-family HTH domain